MFYDYEMTKRHELDGKPFVLTNQGEIPELKSQVVV